MNKQKYNDEEKSLISSLNVSQNESNLQLVSAPNKGQDENRDKGLFDALNRPSKPQKTIQSKSSPSNPDLYPRRGTLSKRFKEDTEENNKAPAESFIQNKGKSARSRSDCSQQDSEEENRCLCKREKICDTDTEDECSDNEKEIPWIILPDNPYKRFWDFLIALLILYSSIVIPYEVAFVDSYDDKWYDTMFDALLMLDIILTFFSAFTDNEENLVKSHRKIIIAYLKSWFFIDFISVIPINLFTPQSFQYNRMTRLSKIPKLYRLLKIAKLLRITRMSSNGNANKIASFLLEKLKVNANIEKFIFFLFTFLLLNHLCACFWYFMAKIQDLNPDCWVVRLGYIDSSNVDIYIISFYWTLTTVTTVGYGDISSGTTVERVYNLVIMSFGVLLYSFAIGSLSSIVATLDQKSAEMNEKLTILSSIKKEFHLNDEIFNKVRKVIKFDLSRNQKDKMNFLQELPNKLRIELSQIMHDKVIQNLYFFRDQPNDFFAYVAPLLKPVKFSQDDFLYKCQDTIDEMYFVSKGTVIFCLDKNYGEKELKEIKKDNNFGEIEMCLNEKLTYDIKIKSKNCELFVMKKNDFLRLSVNFQEFIGSFLHKSLMKYLKFMEEKNKIIMEFEALNEKANASQKGEGAETAKNLQLIDNENEMNEEDEGNEKSYSSSAEEDEEEDIVNSQFDHRTIQQKRRSFDAVGQRRTSNLILNKASNESNAKDVDKKQQQQLDDGNMDNIKDQLDTKFQKKIDKIIEFLDKDDCKLMSTEVNPKELLMQLKSEESLSTKYKLIDQIEIVLKEMYPANKEA